MTLTKADLKELIHKNHDIPRSESSEIIETLLEIIKRTLESGEDVMVSGFGKFCIKAKKERKGRNPATGDDLMLESRRVVLFRCSPVLRDKVNNVRGQ
jgi:integration host factor subunit alpha